MLTYCDTQLSELLLESKQVERNTSNGSSAASYWSRAFCTLL